MRAKTLRLLLTFASTVDAMRMESLAKERLVPGRLIPVPREITAGCGLAWSAPLEGRAPIESLLKDSGLTPQHMVEMLL